MIFRFMDIHPKIRVEVINSSADKNLLENHIDVALRIGQRLDDPCLVARPFLHASFCFYSTPQYIEENGIPLTAEDLQKLNMIRYRFPDGQIYGQLPFGKDKIVEVSGNLIVNSIPLIIEACLQNRGVIFIPEQVANFYVGKGMLVRLFSDIEPSLNYGWLVYSSHNPLSLAARTFIDYMLSEVGNSRECRASDNDLRGMVI